MITGDGTGAVWFLDLPAPDHCEPVIRDAPRLPMKHTILLLAASPNEGGQSALEREARAIQKELESTGHRDRFEFETRWAVEPLDLLRELRRLKPTVVHFTGRGGHGVAGGPPQPGLYLQGPDSAPRAVSRRSRGRSARPARRSSSWCSTPATATCRRRRCSGTSIAWWG